MLNQKKINQNKIKPKNNINKVLLIILILLTVCLCIGTFILSKRRSSISQQNTPIGQTEANMPSETVIKMGKNDPEPFKYHPDEPKLISIPKISVYSYIQNVGTISNAVGVPTNINLAGWYNGSVLPGQKGLSIIDGHVSGKYNPAIFKNLNKLNKNDLLEIKFGDNSTKKFIITSTNTYSTKDANYWLFQKDEKIDKQLNLITCAGKYITSDKTFDQRVIVSARVLE